MHLLTLVSLALTVTTGVSAISIPRSHLHHARHDKPDTYYEGYLEPYMTYHTRYLAIDCDEHHNTSFFDRCCHPMLATETLEKNRDPDCNPANRASTTVAPATPTISQILVPTGDGDDNDGCDDEDPTTTVHSPAPTSTPDDGDESTTPEAPSSTHHASSSTHSAAPTTTQAPTTKEAPTTTKAAPTTTKSSGTPAPTNGSGGGQVQEGGHATFFYQGGQAGACGKVNPDSAFIAALQTELYGDLNAQSKNCGRRIKLTNTNNKKSVEVTVADACPTCGNAKDLDLSVAAFKQIATEAEGYVPITWQFIS